MTCDAKCVVGGQLIKPTVNLGPRSYHISHIIRLGQVYEQQIEFKWKYFWLVG